MLEIDNQATIEIRFTAFGHVRRETITAPLQDDLPKAIAEWVRKQQTAANLMAESNKKRLTQNGAPLVASAVSQPAVPDCPA